MGYCVRFEGKLITDKPLTAAHAAELRGYEDSERWPGDTPVRRFNPWRVTDDGRGFEVLTDKPGDWKAWLQYTIDHFLTPWGYALSGSMTWRGEESGDEGTITIENGRAKARRAKAKPWSEVPQHERHHVIDKIRDAMSDDGRYGEDAWHAALEALGAPLTSDRTAFDP